MFQKSREYETYIKNLVKKVLLLCDEYRIPAFMTFAVSDDGSQTEYVTEMISSVAVNTPLSDDHLAKHADVVSGFEVVPFKEEPLFEETLELVSEEEEGVFENED